MSSRVNSLPQPAGSSSNWLGNLPISVKLIIAFIVVTALSGGILTYFSVTAASHELVPNLGSNLYERGLSQLGTIVNLLDQDTVGHLTTMSLNTLVQDEIVAANNGYSGSPSDIQTQLQSLDQQWIQTSDSDPFVQSRLTNAAANEFQEYRLKFPDNAEVFATDRYGGLVAAAARTSDFYQGDEAWWQQAWNDGKGGVYISQPAYDESAQTYSIIIALTVYAHSTTSIDTPIGVIRITLNINPILTVIRNFKLGETGFIELILPDNTAISPLSDRAVSLSPETIAELQSINPQDRYTQLIYEGQDSVVSQIPMSAVTNKDYLINLGWKLVVHQDTSETLHPVTNAINSTLSTSVVVLAVVVLLAVLVSRLISRPLVRLTRVTERFASGDFSQRAPAAGRDEIGKLASGFNTMADELQDLVGTLEQRISDRVRDLQTVADVNAQISTVLDENRLLQDVVDLTKERFRLYHAHIYRLDTVGQTLVLTAGAGHVGRQMVSEVRTIQMNNPQSIVANAARSRKGVIINNVTESKTFLPHPLLPDTKSELAVPLIARGQLLGVLDVQSDRIDYFTRDTLSVIELLASQVAVAISNARLYENAERTSRHERALGNIDRKIQDAVNMDEILQVTVRELGKALRVPYTAIELRLNQADGENDTGKITS